MTLTLELMAGFLIKKILLLSDFNIKQLIVFKLFRYHHQSYCSARLGEITLHIDQAFILSFALSLFCCDNIVTDLAVTNDMLD